MQANPTNPDGELSNLLKSPLVQFRIDLHTSTLKKNPLETQNSITEEYIRKELLKLQDSHPHPNIQKGLQIAKEWLLGRKSPSASQLQEPETQAAIGFALFLNERRDKKEKSQIEEILKHPRIQNEKTQSALMVSSFIGNQTTKLRLGPPGSWFYYSPKENTINIDIAQALILGLQNSRAVLLHEIGHSEITLGRTPTMQELQKKLDDLLKIQKTKPSRENLLEILKTDLELSTRETAFQYLEDAAVNTFAEITGAESNQKILQSIHRNYTIIGLSRQKETEEMQQNLKKVLQQTKPPEFLEKLTALGYAYPLHHNLAGKNPENWESLGTRNTPKIHNLINDAIDAAQIQPHLQDSRETRINEALYAKSKHQHFQTRTKKFDEIFETHLLEDLQKQKEEIDQIPEITNILLITPQGEALENPNTNPNNPTQIWTISQNSNQSQHDKEKNQTKDQDWEPEESKTLQELLEGAEIEAREQAEAQDKTRGDHRNKLKKQAKASASSKSLLDQIPPLPQGKQTYEGVVETFQAHIKMIGKLIKLTALRQNENKTPLDDIFPDDKTGTNGFQIDSLLNRKIKEETNQKLSRNDFKHWKHQTPKTTPAITRFLLHLDLTGSTHGAVAKMVAITTVILKEATKPYPEIQVIATASQGGKPQPIISPSLPETTQKEIIGRILKTGCGDGDNEIDAEGIIFSLLEAEKLPIPPKKKIGKTHFLLITDGGVSTDVTKKLTPTLQTLLKNPLLEFDILIPDGSENNNLLEELQKPETQNALRRKPNILITKSSHEILKKIALHFRKQIHKYPIQTPESQPQNQRKTRHLSKKIRKIGIGM